MCTLIHRPAEFGCFRVTEETRAAGAGDSLCKTHPVDVTRPLLAAGREGSHVYNKVFCFLNAHMLLQLPEMIKNDLFSSLIFFLWRCRTSPLLQLMTPGGVWHAALSLASAVHSLRVVCEVTCRPVSVPINNPLCTFCWASKAPAAACFEERKPHCLW